MSITNEDRYHLQAKANDILGEKEGATLMELLPLVGWAEVATKSDLNAQTTLLDAKFVVLRYDLTAKMTEQISKLRTETAEQFTGIRAETAEQFTGIRAETAEQFTQIRAETAEQFTGLRAEIGKKHGALLRTMFSLATVMTAILSTVITLAT